MKLQRLDTTSFELLYELNECCVVGFSRMNCHVCQAVMPALETVADKYDGKVCFFRVDIETDRDLFRRFSLKGVPAILFFKAGEYQGKITGLVDEEQLEQRIAQLLQISSEASNV